MARGQGWRGQKGQGASHHVDLEQQQLQPVAPAQVPQAVVDVAGVEMVVAQAGGGDSGDKVTPRTTPQTPQHPQEPRLTSGRGHRCSDPAHSRGRRHQTPKGHCGQISAPGCRAGGGEGGRSGVPRVGTVPPDPLLVQGHQGTGPYPWPGTPQLFPPVSQGARACPPVPPDYGRRSPWVPRYWGMVPSHSQTPGDGPPLSLIHI